LPDPEVLKKMADKLTEKNPKEGGETSLTLDEGQNAQAVDKDQATSKSEVTLLATLVSRLAEQFNENRSDTASEIAELRSLIETKLNNSQVTPPCTASVSATAPQMSHSMHIPPDTGLVPSLAELRADTQLAGQAEKLVDNIQGGIEGKTLNLSSGYNKRGWVRAGGETAPSLRMPWPQDYIFDFGRLKNLLRRFRHFSVGVRLCGHH
jgi:hypothetical protein